MSFEIRVNEKKPSWVARYLVAGAWVYFTLLFDWIILHVLTGDRLTPVSLVSMLAVYLFFPLPVVLALAAWQRRHELWWGSLAAGLAFLSLWGVLFVPRSMRAAQPLAEKPLLKVLTLNALGWNPDPTPQVAMIREVAADLVLLQELNPELAAVLEVELRSHYPYQVLAPAPGVIGMGVLSKHPLKPRSPELPVGGFVGEPQVLELTWREQSITLINFHMLPSSSSAALAQLGIQNQRRTAQARALLDLLPPGQPAILGGDANATPQTGAYQLFTRELRDAWVVGGYGLGHTFPGSAIQGSSRPVLAGIAVPQWLLRIDYIFYSPHWDAALTALAPFDGVSDHRGVVADLVFSVENIEE